MALPVALQVYSVRDFAEKDLKGTLIKIKEMGFAGVEFAGLYGNKPADIKAMCAEIGLVPISAHVPIDELVSSPEKTVADYAEIGCKYIAIPYIVEERRPGAAKFEQTIEEIKMIGEVCKKYNITLLYHNHDFEFVKLDGEYGLDILFNSVDPSLLQTEIDTCWVNVGGEDPASYVVKYTGRAPVVHLKDFSGSKSENMYDLIGIEKKGSARPNNFELRPFGFGNQNVPNILAASVEAGAEWVVCEQDQPSLGKTSLECAAMARKYLELLGW